MAQKRCYKVECFRADRTSQISARQWNELKSSIEELCWSREAYIGGDTLKVGAAAYWSFGSSDFACIDNQWRPQDPILGMSKGAVNDYWPNQVYKLIYEKGPYDGPTTPECGGVSFPWTIQFVDEGNIHADYPENSPYLCGVMIEGLEAPEISAIVQVFAPAMGMYSLCARLPSGTQVLNAIMKYKVNELKIITTTFHWENGVFLEYQVDEQTSGSIAVVHVAEKKYVDRTEYHPVGGSLNFAATSGEWGYVDMKDIVQGYIDSGRDSGYNNFLFIPAPPLTGPIVNWSKASFVALRDAASNIDLYLDEQYHLHLEGWVKHVEYSGLALGEIYVKFKLPDPVGQLDMVYGNLPGQLPTT